MRAPRDAEILVAIVAGQIVGGIHASPLIDSESSRERIVQDSVDYAEDIVGEVLARGDDRANV